VPPLSSRSALTSYYLHSKAKALRLLSRALADVSTSNSIATVFTAILLTILELFESGAGSWSVHLEGVKRLVEAGDFLRPDDPGSVLNVVTR
jgi:hypothetical protein